MVVLGNVSGVLNLMVFVFLITFLTAIFAVQLFREEIPQIDSNTFSIRVNFSNIYNSFIGMYQIFSSENWTTILYNITSFEQSFGTGWIGASFVILWFILANCESDRVGHGPGMHADIGRNTSHRVEHVHSGHSGEL